MAMLEKHRNVLYNHFAPQLGEEVTQALMSNFPSRDVEEPVTKADLAATRADLREEIGGVRAELSATRADLRDEIAGVRLDVANLKTDIQHALNRQLVIFTTLLSVAVGILLRAG